jgi:hypothetical protein
MIPLSPSRFGSRLDVPLLSAVLLAAAVVVPRSYLIARAHSETVDAEYHIVRGLAYWTGTIAKQDLSLNDPPLGEGLVALPVLWTNVWEGRDPADARIYDVPGRAERLAVRCGVWNALLFLPLVTTLFHWCRKLYGTAAAWLAWGLLVVEPNFAAHVPLTTVDVVGVSGIVIASYLAWRYFDCPGRGRLAAMGVATGVALMLKHTAIVLPPVVVAFAGLWWVVRPYRDGQDWAGWRGRLPGRLGATAAGAAIVIATILVLTSFERCPPKSAAVATRAVGASAGQRARLVRLEEALHLDSPWPAGVYLRAFRSGFGHGLYGHPGYLFGEERETGWWYYFPAVGTYKVPIGVAVVLVLGLISVAWGPPRWGEWGLMLPLAAWALFMMNSRVNIGYRHFLAPYLFAIALASRCLVPPGLVRTALAWCALGAAALHAAAFHPDYLGYINLPRHKPYLAISDSNVDWGQTLKQARAWLDAHPQPGRTVWLRYFGAVPGGIRYYLGGRVASLGDDDPAPTSGLLIISKVYEAGPYGPPDAYTALWPHEPDAEIGQGLLVYDLDRLGGGSPFRWTPGGGGQAVAPAATALR